MDFEIHSFSVTVPWSISRKQPELGRNGEGGGKLLFCPIKRGKHIKDLFTETLYKKKTEVKSEGRFVS